jgi:hypothetical protein
MQSKSWFINIVKIAHKYKLASPHILISSPHEAKKWSTMAKRKVLEHWKESMIRSGRDKSTLQYASLESMSFKEPCQTWRGTEPNMRDVARARVKCKLQSGTYMLQYNRAKFNKQDPDPSCILCRSAVENTSHFIIECPVLQPVRLPFVQKIRALVGSQLAFQTHDFSKEELTQLILDSSALPLSRSMNRVTVDSLEKLARTLCFALHAKRTQLLRITALKGPLTTATEMMAAPNKGAG